MYIYVSVSQYGFLRVPSNNRHIGVRDCHCGYKTTEGERICCCSYFNIFLIMLKIFFPKICLLHQMPFKEVTHRKNNEFFVAALTNTKCQFTSTFISILNLLFHLTLFYLDIVTQKSKP